jgi:hypothetical protein
VNQVQGSGFRVQKFRVQKFRVQKFRVQRLGFWFSEANLEL